MVVHLSLPRPAYPLVCFFNFPDFTFKRPTLSLPSNSQMHHPRPEKLNIRTPIAKFDPLQTPGDWPAPPHGKNSDLCNNPLVIILLYVVRSWQERVQCIHTWKSRQTLCNIKSSRRRFMSVKPLFNLLSCDT
jgi:hypothetical protein